MANFFQRPFIDRRFRIIWKVCEEPPKKRIFGGEVGEGPRGLPDKSNAKGV
jgi:hypothetical protein